jgi:hypothetical protein
MTATILNLKKMVRIMGAEEIKEKLSNKFQISLKLLIVFLEIF